MINPTLSFQSMKTAYTTIKSIEIMRMLREGHLIAGCMGIVTKQNLSIHYLIFTINKITRPKSNFLIKFIFLQHSRRFSIWSPRIVAYNPFRKTILRVTSTVINGELYPL